jgi:hypothetical protein
LVNAVQGRPISNDQIEALGQWLTGTTVFRLFTTVQSVLLT